MLKILWNRLHVFYFYLSIVIYKFICAKFKYGSYPRVGRDICTHHFNVYQVGYELTFFTESSHWEPEPYLCCCISGREVREGDLVVYETHGKKLVYRAYAPYAVDEANILAMLDLLGIHGTDLYLTTMDITEARLLDEIYNTYYYDDEAMQMSNLRENLNRPFL